MALLAQATYTVKRAAKDGYSVSLSPESIVLTKNSSGVVSDLSTAKTKVSLTVGGNGVTPAIGTLVVSGCAATKSGMDITITSVLASSGYVDIPVTYKNFSATKRFAFTTVMVDPVTIKKEVQSQLAVESELIVAEVTATTKVYVNGKMDELAIGGRNYAIGTSNAWSTEYVLSNGKNQVMTNFCTKVGLIGFNENDSLTISFDYEYNDFNKSEGALVSLQGSGNVTAWNSGSFPGKSMISLLDFTAKSGLIHVSYTVVLNANHIKNEFWLVGIRHDCIIGRARVRNFKVERGNKATDWTPAPEDVDANISNVQTQVTSAVSRLTIAETNIKTLVSQTTTIGNTVSSHSTSINQLNNQIALKADSTTVTGINTRLTSAEAKITPNAINLTVKSQITTAVNDVKVGGRNLIIRSGELKNTLVGTTGELQGGGNSDTMVNNISVTPGEVLAFSKRDVTTDSYWRWKWLDNEGNYIARTANNSNFLLWTVPNNAYSIQVSYPDAAYPKVERGNKATDWTPAPEDVDAAIALRPTTSEIKAGISITSGGISVFGQTLSLAGKVTFSSLDSSTQSTINGKATTGYVDSAKSSAISTAASDATTKANTALANAKSYSDTLKNSLGGLAYLSAVSLAKLDSTIVEGGYIKTSLIDADAIITGQLIADRIFSTDITTGRLTVTTGAKVAGFKVSGNSLTNEGFNNDAYIIIRNDDLGTFVGIGGNVANGISEFATTARIENNRKDKPVGDVIALRLSASGCQSYYSNVALAITSGYISGFRLNVRTVSSSQTLSVMDSIIISVSDSEISLTLPTSPEKGQMYFIRKNGGGRVWINGNYIINDGDWYRERSTSVQLNRGGLGILMYNGVYWTWNNTNG